MGKEADNESAAGNKNNILFYTGVSGSGKDYLLKQALALGRRDSRTDISVVNFGEMLFRRLQVTDASGDASTRDDIKNSSQADVVKSTVDSLIEEVVQMQPLVLNTHVAYKQKGSIQINTGTLRRLAPEAYVFIYARPNQIRKWRVADGSRQRGDDDEIDIAIHQDIALSATQIFAARFRAHLEVIDNQVGNVEENARLIYGSIQQIHN